MCSFKDLDGFCDGCCYRRGCDGDLLKCCYLKSRDGSCLIDDENHSFLYFIQ